MLPASVLNIPEVEEGSVDQFEEYLVHNELELALDELASLGAHNQCCDEFWRELIAAADNMGLPERVLEFRARLKTSEQRDPPLKR